MKKFSIRILVVAALLVTASTTFSMAKFGAYNPISTAYGLFRVMFTDTDYLQIQAEPKVVLSKPDSSLLPEYMASLGYEELESERMGAIHMFAQNGETVQVIYSQNAYFSKWNW